MSSANDVLIYAHDLSDLVLMLEMLIIELKKVRLELNTDETKILTNEIGYAQRETKTTVDITDGPVSILADNNTNKYLGRRLNGDLRLRGMTELRNQIGIT